MATGPLCSGKQIKSGSPKAKAATPAVSPSGPSYTNVFAQTLIAAAANDTRVVAITAAMPGGTGVAAFGKKYPDRTFDVGIAEQVREKRMPPLFPPLFQAMESLSFVSALV